MENIKAIIKNKSLKGDYRNKYEFQAYGNKLADDLNDRKHRSLYLRLAKNEDRNLVEAARVFVMGAEKISEKGRLFMWKLAELKKGKELKNDDN